MSNKSSPLMTEKKLKRALTRIAHEIVEHNSGAESLVLVGILTRGAPLARRIADIIEDIEGIKPPVGFMDISLYRDDVHSKLDQPIVQRTDLIHPIGDRNLVLIDDVLFTGRTIRAALAQIVDFGRPRTVQLAVLIDRGHRELPIKADYVGLNVPTAKDDQVVVEVEERDGEDRVYIKPGKGKTAPAGKKTAGKTARKGRARTKGKGKGGKS